MIALRGFPKRWQTNSKEKDSIKEEIEDDCIQQDRLEGGKPITKKKNLESREIEEITVPRSQEKTPKELEW